MPLPVDPIHMSVEEILTDVLADHRDVSNLGPEAALTYLNRVIRDTIDLPHAALMVIYDLIAEAQAELQDWDGCALSIAKALEERKLVRAEAPLEPLIIRENLQIGRNDIAVPAAQERAPVLASGQVPTTRDAAVGLGTEETGLKKPIGEGGAPIKICCRCGKDVSHRARRKDTGTNTYVCRECFELHHRAKPKGGLQLKRPLLWIVLISLLALSVLILLRA